MHAVGVVSWNWYLAVVLASLGVVLLSCRWSMFDPASANKHGLAPFVHDTGVMWWNRYLAVVALSGVVLPSSR